MRYNTHTVIDEAFRSVPHPFHQCIIAMVYDKGTEIYVPIVNALVTCKNEYIYSEVFNQIVVLMEYNWRPCIIITDFEKALISSIKYRIFREQNSWVLFSLETSHQKEVNKIQNINQA
ncbi:hypothetical protein HZS_7211 [Henneguya salminicola]|nr:hypothetical protein HZS_7211 [Henneguya salminicola]